MIFSFFLKNLHTTSGVLPPTSPLNYTLKAEKHCSLHKGAHGQQRPGTGWNALLENGNKMLLPHSIAASVHTGHDGYPIWPQPWNWLPVEVSKVEQVRFRCSLRICALPVINVRNIAVAVGHYGNADAVDVFPTAGTNRDGICNRRHILSILLPMKEIIFSFDLRFRPSVPSVVGRCNGKLKGMFYVIILQQWVELTKKKENSPVTNRKWCWASVSKLLRTARNIDLEFYKP